MSTVLKLALLLGAVQAAPTVPSLPLYNAAEAGMAIPAIGFGTGGYSGNSSTPYGGGGGPECFNGCSQPECIPADPPGYECEEYVQAAVRGWIELGGTRIDNADSYHNQRPVAIAMANSGVPRKELFVTSKIGPYLPLGYQDAHDQFKSILASTGWEYVDLLLIHWPKCQKDGCTTAQDPLCNTKSGSYNETSCRLSTWKAMLEIHQSGQARAVGTSNFNSAQLQEIVTAGMTLPSVNQNPFHIYHSEAELATMAFCKAHRIQFNGYSPLGVPDRRVFKPPMARTPILDPVALEIAARTNRTSAQVQLAWQYQLGLITNPRSQNAAHMLENLEVFALPPLSAADMAALSSRPQA